MVLDVENLGNVNFQAFDYMALLGGVWTVFKYILIAGILIFVFLYFIIRPLKYKDIIEIWDRTGTGTVTSADKGCWKEEKDGQEAYILFKHKEARLKHPGLENAILTKKGKFKYTFLRFGDGPFDYSVIPPVMMNGDIPSALPLADAAWAKQGIKGAAEKNKISGWFNENKGFIISVTAMVLAMILMISVIPAARDAVTSISAANSKYVDQLAAIATQLERVADKLGGTAAANAIENPPPGI